MSLSRRDAILPEWEPVPWEMDADAADEQERGFYKRAQMAIQWQPIPWKSFPSEGIFGSQRDWLSSVDAAFFATGDEEDLILIDNTWFGWPDPPRWGLISRPTGHDNSPWQHWGHFPDVPTAWNVPAAERSAENLL